MARDGFLNAAYADRNVDETRTFYDDWSKVYDAELGENDYRQPVRCAEALAGLLSDKNATIMDIGCGTGLSGVALSALGFTNIDGCDLSPGMLEIASKTGVYKDLFEFNLNEPPFPRDDNTVDAITAVGVFSFGHVMADALDEFVRMAKPGAPVIIGLNDHFYQEGSLTNKISLLERAGKMTTISEEQGEHIPGIDLTGWVISLKCTSAC